MRRGGLGTRQTIILTLIVAGASIGVLALVLGLMVLLAPLG